MRPSLVRARAVVLAALVTVPALAACGGPGASGAPSADPSPTASTAADASPGTASPTDAADAAGDAATTSTVASTDPSAAPTLAAEDCATLTAAWTKTNKALLSLSDEHPRALVAGLLTARDAMADVDAPAGVTDDWATVRTFLDDAGTAVQDVDPGDAKAVAAALDTAVKPGTSDAVAGASQEITAFLATSC